MKSKILLAMCLTSMIFISCKKENDGGIRIDADGKPLPFTKASGTSMDPSGKPSGTTRNAGTCIDPNGSPMGKDSVTSDYGIMIDPDGKPNP